MTIFHKTFLPVFICTFLLVCGSSGQAQTSNEPLAIFNYSPTGMAGDVIYLQGSGFGSRPTVQFSHNDSRWTTLATLTVASDAVTVRLPSDPQLPFDLITLRISPNGSTWSQPVYVNRAHAMHFGTAEIVPGGAFRIFGRNLFYARQPTVRFVDTANGSSYAGVVSTTSNSAYLLNATAPNGLIAGHTYSVYVNNGYNGNAGTGGETVADQSLLCRPAAVDHWQLNVPWVSDLNFYNNVYNVRTDSRLSSHATGNGSTNDAPAIQQAVQTAASAGGGVVYLPAGTYKLSFSSGCALGLSSRVVLAGAGIGTTVLTYGADPPPVSGGYAICFADQASGLANLSLINVDQTGKWPQSGLAINSNELFLQRVQWNIGTSQWISLTGVNNLAIENSQITQGVDANFNYNGPLELGGTSHFLIQGNTFTYVCWGFDFGSTQDGIFEGNTIVRNATVPLPQSVTTHVIAASFVNNFAVLDNEFLVTGSPVPNNDGETLLSEGGGPSRPDEFRGTVSAINGLTLTDANQNFLSGNPTLHAGNSIVAIVQGQGAGQWRTVTGVSSSGLTIDRPWTVAPAVGSNYATFDWSAANWTVAGNVMTGNEKGIELFDASARDILITGNQLTNNSGIMISPEQNPTGEFNVAYGIQVTGNRIADTSQQWPAYSAVVPREDSQTSLFGTAVLGIEIRNNVITTTSPNTFVQQSDDEKAVVEGMNCYWQWQTLQSASSSNLPAILGTIFQGNTLQNSDTAFYLNSGSYGTVIEGTILQNVGQLLEDGEISGTGHASVDTLVQNTVD
jgi:hypothetical protein